MSDYSKKIVYLSQAQYQELITNDTITVDGVTVNYNDNDIYVTPQAEPITDVKINGTSIGSNGVANIPKATSSSLGIIKASNSGGLNIDNNGMLTIYAASHSSIKGGTNTSLPITSGTQHQSVFYGLSKIAGVNLANETITLGTYPDSSKAAIQNMLGITNLISTEESPTAIAAHAANSLFMMDGKLMRATTAVAIGDAVAVGTNCEVVKADEVFVNKKQYATSGTPGLVSVSSSFGVGIWSNSGAIFIQKASADELKAGTHNYRPVVPANLDTSIYYGLSKLAGVNLANETVTVGTYPETSKTAIRNMIGATSNKVIAVQDEQPTDTDTKIWLPETEDAGIQVPTYEEFQALNTNLNTNYVQKTDKATTSTLGLVKAGTNGIAMDSGGALYLAYAGESAIKAGNSTYSAITTTNQHLSVFYGLAKAAGDTTQSISTNAVGTYTDDAKAAIKNMLGITQTLTVTVLTQDNVTVTGQTVTVRATNATGPVFATAAYEGQPVAFAVPSGFAYYVSVSDTLAHHFNPTTASGVITNTDVSVNLQYSDFSTIRTAADIKAALNAGLDLTDLVGEQISCTWNNSTLVWDIVDYSNDTITLLTHDTLPTQLVFEPVQALMWCENGLAAGSYSFIDGSSTYYFTLTTAIPSGGQLRATTSAFQTYASMEATATLETGTVSTTEISGATSLGTTATGNLNHMSRVNYGSNNYKESALFQWLNSTEAANTPMPRITKFSRPCTYSVPGFLGALDSSFVAAIDDTIWLCSTNNTYECPTSLGGTVAKSNAYTVTAKVGLASEMEIFGSYGGTADGSAVFDLFNGATADDRKKYQPGTSTARYWWLRSPGWSNASSERSVGSSGAAYNYNAYYSHGVVPAVKISKTVVPE